MLFTSYSMLLSLVLRRSASFTPNTRFSNIRYWSLNTQALGLPHAKHTVSFISHNVNNPISHNVNNPISSWPKDQAYWSSSTQQVRCLSSSAAAADSLSTEAPMVYPSFEETASLHPLLKQNVRNMKLKTMTEIQAGTWDAASSGQDVLGRARTGTGKTVAFLLPAINQLLISAQEQRLRKYETIQMLILSPTRELASQIHDQATKLTHSSTVITNQVMFGGSSKFRDISTMERHLPTVLVATPGRLKDHLENTELHGKPFHSFLKDVRIFVLDETDRLLDMGFKKDVDYIMSCLPNKERRQTLLFSATVPEEVKSVINQTMRRKYITVDCIHDTDPATQTNAQVEQTHVIVPSTTRLVSGTVEILAKLIADTKAANEPLKLVVFHNTAHLVGFYSELFTTLPKITRNLPIFELHSRKSQSFRTRTSDAFRGAKEGILFTSDVSARGVDYPGVTDVVQFGVPDSRESYIHRLGRTGRAGKQGEGLLVLSDLEKNFLADLSGLDVGVNKVFQELINSPTSDTIRNELEPILKAIGNGDHSALQSSAKAAYRSKLGFYKGKLGKLGHPGEDRLIDFVNSFSQQVGLKELPEMEMQTIRKMGLRNHASLNVVHVASRGSGGRGSSDSRWGPGARTYNSRQMSTDTRNGMLPTKRTISSDDGNYIQESSVVNSPKKSRSVGFPTGATGRVVSRNRRRQPNGRGAELSKSSL